MKLPQICHLGEFELASRLLVTLGLVQGSTCQDKFEMQEHGITAFATLCL